MADHVGELDDGDAGFELFDDKGVAEIVDLGSRNARDAEVTIDGGPDIADQEGVAGFGDKEGGIFGFGATPDVFFDRGFGGIVEGDASRVMGLKGTNFEMRFLQGDVLELETRQLANSEPCLEQELDDAIHTNIVLDGVTKSTVFERGEDTGGGNLVFGMADTGGR